MVWRDRRFLICTTLPGGGGGLGLGLGFYRLYWTARVQWAQTPAHNSTVQQCALVAVAAAILNLVGAWKDGSIGIW